MNADTVEARGRRRIGAKWRALFSSKPDALAEIGALVGLGPDADGQLVVRAVRARLTALARLRAGVCHALALPSAEDELRRGNRPTGDDELIRYVFDLWGRHDDVTRHTFALDELWPDALRGVRFDHSLDVASDQFTHLVNYTVAQVRQMRRAEADLHGRITRLDGARKEYAEALAAVSTSSSASRQEAPRLLVGRDLAAWIHARCMTQVQAALLLGVTQSTVSKAVCRPDRALPAAVAAAVAAALDADTARRAT